MDEFAGVYPICLLNGREITHVTAKPKPRAPTGLTTAATTYTNHRTALKMHFGPTIAYRGRESWGEQLKSSLVIRYLLPQLLVKKHLLLALLAATALNLGACTKDTDTEQGTGLAKMEVRLTDAPGDFQEVNIDVRNVQIHVTDDNNPNGWQELTLIRPGIYNLLNLTNGNTALLTSADLPAGKVSQLRLVLGPNNTVVTRDGQVYPLKVPSGAESGLKLKIDAELTADVTYQLVLDFDVAKSVKDRGGSNKNEKFKLKPTIRVITTAVAGGIRGSVIPTAARPNVMAIRTSAPIDTFSTYPDATGTFLLRSLPSGMYRVEFSAAAPYRNQTRTNVSVPTDRVVDLGEIDVN
jgi:Domain of unknown function (DUF4382)